MEERTTEERLAGALWAMIIEYGGDNKIDAIHPGFKGVAEEGVGILTELGYYVKGQGFSTMKHSGADNHTATEARTIYGTCRRGSGREVHYAHARTMKREGRVVLTAVQANCQGNGQWTGRDFEEGNGRTVTCRTCNGTQNIASPAERTATANSCTSINKETGKQCTFEGFGDPRLCNIHRNAKRRQEWKADRAKGKE